MEEEEEEEEEDWERMWERMGGLEEEEDEEEEEEEWLSVSDPLPFTSVTSSSSVEEESKEEEEEEDNDERLITPNLIRSLSIFCLANWPWRLRERIILFKTRSSQASASGDASIFPLEYFLFECLFLLFLLLLILCARIREGETRRAKLRRWVGRAKSTTERISSERRRQQMPGRAGVNAGREMVLGGRRGGEVEEEEEEEEVDDDDEEEEEGDEEEEEEETVVVELLFLSLLLLLLLLFDTSTGCVELYLDCVFVRSESSASSTVAWMSKIIPFSERIPVLPCWFESNEKAEEEEEEEEEEEGLGRGAGMESGGGLSREVRNAEGIGADEIEEEGVEEEDDDVVDDEVLAFVE